VDPLTGEGIPQAIESGLLAAKAIDDFLVGRNPLSRYAQTIQETLAQELFYAGRLARFLFNHPYLSYRLLSTHSGTASLLVHIMRGEISYRDLYLKLKKHPLGQLYSLAKKAKSVLTSKMVKTSRINL
jgi:flavin-dependent dehydrogenase